MTERYDVTEDERAGAQQVVEIVERDGDQISRAELGLLLDEILIRLGWLEQAISQPDLPSGIRAVTVGDAVEAFRGNCWDDHHDGGEHKFDLLLARKVMLAIGYPEAEVDSRESIADLEDHSDW